MNLINKIFGDPNEKTLKNLQPIVEKINNLEPDFEKLGDEEFKVKTENFKKEIGEISNDTTEPGETASAEGEAQKKTRKELKEE